MTLHEGGRQLDGGVPAHHESGRIVVVIAGQDGNGRACLIVSGTGASPLAIEVFDRFGNCVAWDAVLTTYRPSTEEIATLQPATRNV